MTAFVTGAPGWLGTRLVAHLVGRARGVVPSPPRPVRCLVEPGAGTRALAALEGAAIVEGDIRDPASAERLLERGGGGTVFHCAGIIHPANSIRQLYEVNVDGTKNLLTAAARAGIRRFIHVSSSSPFGFNGSPGGSFDESAPYNPTLHYGRSKMLAELAVKAAEDAGQLETVILRPPWFYGPDHPARQTLFFTMIRTGKVPLVGNGDNRRSMAYVDNLCQGLLLCDLVPAARGHVYWIADKRPYTMNEIIETIEDVMNKDFHIEPARRRMRLPSIASEVARTVDKGMQAMGLYHPKIHVLSEMNKTIVCSIAKAEQELGYAPQIDLAEGVRRSMRWMKERGVAW